MTLQQLRTRLTRLHKARSILAEDAYLRDSQFTFDIGEEIEKWEHDLKQVEKFKHELATRKKL